MIYPPHNLIISKKNFIPSMIFKYRYSQFPNTLFYSLFAKQIFFINLFFIIYMCKQILALAAIIFLTLTACPANYNIKNLAAGISLFNTDSLSFTTNTNSTSTSQDYIHSFKRAFSNVPVFALGRPWII